MHDFSYLPMSPALAPVLHLSMIVFIAIPPRHSEGISLGGKNAAIGGLGACRQPCKGEKMSAVERKLTTIVAADVVGFSRLMGEDETGTLEALMACRSIIDQIIEDHHGRIFGSAGDSVVAEFA